ncbi:MAG: branched-chain amino acid ABC transporter permease [Chloroflexi bacterium]|nr:branched-chain amino acid ABC transporter permease [Chloroflexota bacterium]
MSQTLAPAMPTASRQPNFGTLARNLFIAVVLTYPFLDLAFGWQALLAFIPMMLMITLAMGLNIVVGYAGLLDLGYAAFYAIGAYAAAFFTSPVSPLNAILPDSPFFWMQDFWVAMILAVLVAGLAGALLGAPTLRLRGDYLALVTLGFGEIVPRLVKNLEPWTKGVKGMNPIGRPYLFDCTFGVDPCTIFGTQYKLGMIPYYYVTLAIGALSIFLIIRLRNSRLGRAWAAIRDDEIAAQGMGINPVTTKLWAFALGASFSGATGAIFGAYLQTISPDQFEYSTSVIVLCMVILGGTGNVWGVMFGGLLIQSFDRIFAERLTGWVHKFGAATGVPAVATLLSNFDLLRSRLFIFGLCLVLLMALRPQGLLPARKRRESALIDETEEEANARHDAAVAQAGGPQ